MSWITFEKSIEYGESKHYLTLSSVLISVWFQSVATIVREELLALTSISISVD